LLWNIWWELLVLWEGGGGGGGGAVVMVPTSHTHSLSLSLSLFLSCKLVLEYFDPTKLGLCVDSFGTFSSDLTSLV